MDTQQIASLLVPYAGHGRLTEAQLRQLSDYLDLLSLWNARTNLTSLRDEESIVERHFGESLFAASVLVGEDARVSVADVGSGAGFPGVPLKVLRHGVRLTLIEAHGKKATFLREVIRKLRLVGAVVAAQRAEALAETFDLVTMRAVENFQGVLPAAAGLVAPGGTLGLLVGSEQVEEASRLLPEFEWKEPVSTPKSSNRVVFAGVKPEDY